MINHLAIVENVPGGSGPGFPFITGARLTLILLLRWEHTLWRQITMRGRRYENGKKNSGPCVGINICVKSHESQSQDWTRKNRSQVGRCPLLRVATGPAWGIWGRSLGNLWRTQKGLLWDKVATVEHLLPTQSILKPDEDRTSHRRPCPFFYSPNLLGSTQRR